MDRRRFIKLMLAAGGAAVLGGYATYRLPQTGGSRPEPPPNSHISAIQNYTGSTTTSAPPLTPENLWYVVQIGPTPTVDVGNYALVVDGLVENPLKLTYKELASLPSVELVTTLQCVSDPYFLRATVKWRGVKLSDILNMAGVSKNAVKVVAYGADGYTSDLPLWKAMEPDTLVAYMADGEPLPSKHGYPVRLVVPRWWGYKSVKWLVKLTVTDKDYLGYWESVGYPDVARKDGGE
ncbi:molybdopterin-dependent oxidoreductase [Thermoproteus uzoniensis]|nr:molybdopterin-dependent oxidoreductase [Thermoproteus uzoniensis]